LKINGIAVSPILAGAGIFGVAVGFAAKETIADILAGIFLIIDRPIRIGDRVTIDKIGKHWGGWGDIIDIGLRRTIIRNTDGVVVNYPNSLLSSGIIKTQKKYVKLLLAPLKKSTESFTTILVSLFVLCGMTPKVINFLVSCMKLDTFLKMLKREPWSDHMY